MILSSQSGLENIIATSGTALTNLQLKSLGRYSKNLSSAFDMDIAGSLATKRGIDLARVQGFDVKVVTMPKGSDPADVISENPKEWQNLVEGAKSILEFYFDSALSRFDRETIDGKKEISKILLPILKRVPSKIEQSFWVERLSKVLEIKEEAISEELKKIRLETPEISPTLIKKPERSRRELLEERICTLALIDQENLSFISNEDILLLSGKFSRLVSWLKQNPQKEPEDLELKELSDLLYLRGEVEGKMKSLGELKRCLLEFRDLSTKEKLDEISKKIKQAESEKDIPRVKELIQRFNILTKDIKK